MGKSISYTIARNNCPKCGSSNYTEATSGEHCEDCGYFFWYG